MCVEIKELNKASKKEKGKRKKKNLGVNNRVMESTANRECVTNNSPLRQLSKARKKKHFPQILQKKKCSTKISLNQF